MPKERTDKINRYIPAKTNEIKRITRAILKMKRGFVHLSKSIQQFGMTMNNFFYGNN